MNHLLSWSQLLETFIQRDYKVSLVIKGGSPVIAALLKLPECGFNGHIITDLREMMDCVFSLKTATFLRKDLECTMSFT